MDCSKEKMAQLKPAYRAKQYTFASFKKNWTMKDWESVVWSDETKVNRVGSDGRKYVDRKSVV